MERSHQYIWFVYLGALPFIACLGAVYMNWSPPAELASPTEIAIIYGLLIASFMAGTHWGTFLYKAEQSPVNLFVASNALTVAVWLIYLTKNEMLILVALVLAFIALYVVDVLLHQHRLISSHYLQTRRNVTGIVLFCLVGLLLAPEWRVS